MLRAKEIGSPKDEPIIDYPIISGKPQNHTHTSNQNGLNRQLCLYIDAYMYMLQRYVTIKSKEKGRKRKSYF